MSFVNNSFESVFATLMRFLWFFGIIFTTWLYESYLNIQNYFFKSSDSLESGLKIDKTIEEYISNNFNSIQEYPIIDNLLTTYTNK